MSVINMAKTIKEIHPNAVIMYKVGSFCQMFGKDAYIMAYIFGYKLVNKNDIPNCGFPIRTLDKVKAKLENAKVDYIILDTRNNYDVEEKEENGNLNKYGEFLEKSKTYIKKKNRIDKIYNNMLLMINDERIREKIQGARRRYLDLGSIKVYILLEFMKH